MSDCIQPPRMHLVTQSIESKRKVIIRRFPSEGIQAKHPKPKVPTNILKNPSCECVVESCSDIVRFATASFMWDYEKGHRLMNVVSPASGFQLPKPSSKHISITMHGRYSFVIKDFRVHCFLISFISSP